MPAAAGTGELVAELTPSCAHGGRPRGQRKSVPKNAFF
jgi:hypothetical protein